MISTFFPALAIDGSTDVETWSCPRCDFVFSFVPRDSEDDASTIKRAHIETRHGCLDCDVAVGDPCRCEQQEPSDA